MPRQIVEMTLVAECGDEAVAAKVAESLARVSLGLSAEDAVTTELRFDRYVVPCAHEHDEQDPRDEDEPESAGGVAS